MRLDRLFLMAVILSAGPTGAAPLQTDAFGIAEQGDASRNHWSGLVEVLGPQGVSGRMKPTGAGAHIIFNLGDKSLVAGGKPGQVAALVLDAAGNLVADGTQVTFVTGSATANRLTRGAIASHLFAPGITAGQFHAGAGIAGHQSGRVDYVVYAQTASAVPQLATAPASPSLPEDFQDLATLPLADRFGNTVEDGTGIAVHLTHPDGSVTLLDGIVAGGIAKARFLARDTASNALVTATLAARHSPPAAFQTKPLEPLGKVAIEAEYLADILATRLRVGPFLTAAGYALNDGATVTITVTTARGGRTVVSGWVLDGVLQTTLLVSAADYPIDIAVTTLLGTVTQHVDAPTTGQTP
jgi:hypothetical protein